MYNVEEKNGKGKGGPLKTMNISMGQRGRKGK